MGIFSFVATCFVVPRVFRHHHSTLQQPPPPFSLSRRYSTTTDHDLLVTVREGIAERNGPDALQDWHNSVTVIQAVMVGGDNPAAERLLADATRWSGWARAGKLARKYIQPEAPPSPTALQASLEWLQTGPLALSMAQIVEAIEQYPQLYLLDPANAYRQVLGVAPRKYRDALPAMIAEYYSVLQFRYNCDNDCMSECGSCWVTFQNRG